jgi:peptidoglycan/LPS O-acetylase OafA/YrhL
MSAPSVATASAPPESRSAARAGFNIPAHGLRGIASLMVFCAHIMGGTAKHIYNTNADYVAAVEKPWSFGIYGVNIFFVISGFVIYQSVKQYSPKEFALRRFLRLYPLFFAMSVLFVVLNAATNAYPATNDLKSVLSGFLFLDLFTGTEQLTPNAWSLTYEVIFYALTCFVFTAIVTLQKPLLGALAAALSLAFLIAYPIAFYFLGGVLVRILYERDITPPPALRLWAEAALLAGCVVLGSTGHIDYTWAALAKPENALRIAVTIGFFYVAVQPDSLTERALKWPVFLYFGTISYSLYLVHPYTYYAVRALFGKAHLFGPNPFLSVALFGLVTFAVTVPITHLVNHYLERRPYEWFFKQRVFAKGPRAG